jgi:hypothetical protein
MIDVASADQLNRLEAVETQGDTRPPANGSGPLSAGVAASEFALQSTRGRTEFSIY